MNEVNIISVVVVFLLIAVVVGFESRTYTVDEADGQVELCVNITVPRRQNIGTVTFNLIVETQDGSAGIGNGSVIQRFTNKYIHIL